MYISRIVWMIKNNARGLGVDDDVQRADLRQPELLVLDAARVDLLPRARRVGLARRVHGRLVLAEVHQARRYPREVGDGAEEDIRGLVRGLAVTPLGHTSWMRPTLGAELNASSEANSSPLLHLYIVGPGRKRLVTPGKAKTAISKPNSGSVTLVAVAESSLDSSALHQHDVPARLWSLESPAASSRLDSVEHLGLRGKIAGVPQHQHLLRLEGRRRVLREARPAAPAQLSFLSSSTSPTTTGCQAARVLPRRAVHLWAQGANRGGTDLRVAHHRQPRRARG